MKWLGQHIWDFISRFRTTVYLENLETSSDENVLVVDSDGKVTKNTSLGGSDLTLTNETDNRVITSTGGTGLNAEANFTFDGTTLQINPTLAGTESVLDITPTLTSGVNIGSLWDFNVSSDIDHSLTCLKIDYDKTAALSSGKDANITGFIVELTDTATNDSNSDGTYYGITNTITQSNATGDIVQYGIRNTLSGGDTQVGILNYCTGATVGTTTGFKQKVEDGGTDIYLQSSDTTTVDYFSVATGASGATTITTVDGGGTAADLTFTVDGSVFVNSTLTTFQDAAGAIVSIDNTADNATGGNLVIRNGRGGNDAADDDDLGTISFTGYDDGTPSTQIYATIEAQVADATSGQEAGRLEFKVAEYDGTTTTGLKLDGDTNADGEIDVTIGAGAASVTTIAGTFVCASRTLALSSSTDGDHDGDVVYFGGTTSMTIGKIYHYKSDGTWEIVNADAVATSDGLLGVALGAASDTNGMLLRGMVTLDHDPGAIGDVLFVQSDNAGTPGNATATAPSASGDCIRVIGYQVSHASNGNVWFNPDNTFVEHA